MSTLKVDALQDTSGNGFYPTRAWVNLNGTGTVAIRGDENVSSITDNSTGSYTANYSNNFADANYAASGVVNNIGQGAECWQIHSTSQVPTASLIRVHSTRSGASFDATFVNVMVTGNM
jgi:hypothetical protein